MVDVLSPEQRRLNMSRIRGRDTKPEILVRKGLHSRGLRYRLHDRTLPGRPDLVFPKYRTVIFVHGCFWHLHGCSLSKLPETHEEFWRQKLTTNKSRDAEVVTKLMADGWRVLLIWECAIRGREKAPLFRVLDLVEQFVKSGKPDFSQIPPFEISIKRPE